MSQYIFKRLWQGAIAIIGALLIVFVAQRLAGDPVALMLPMEATEEDFAAMRAQLGLDRPFIVQFGIFFMDALRGEFGTSYHWNQAAMYLLLDSIPATLELAMAC